jgi:DNA excision repair protein ERCC-8
MLYPNEKEILMFDVFQGTLLKRLRLSGVLVAQARGNTGQRNMKSRITSLAWRAGNVEMYSAHSDGVLRAWLPRTPEEVELDEEEALEGEAGEDEGRKRKRQALDEVFRDLTRQKIIFT